MMWFFDQYPYVLNYIQFGRLHKIIVCDSQRAVKFMSNEWEAIRGQRQNRETQAAL